MIYVSVPDRDIKLQESLSISGLEIPHSHIQPDLLSQNSASWVKTPPPEQQQTETWRKTFLPKILWQCEHLPEHQSLRPLYSWWVLPHEPTEQITCKKPHAGAGLTALDLLSLWVDCIFFFKECLFRKIRNNYISWPETGSNPSAWRTGV